MILTWKFSMTPLLGPMWDMFDDGKLVAYARRDKHEGWFVRIRGLNYSADKERLYIGDCVDPVNIMKLMLEMHKEENV